SHRYGNLLQGIPRRGNSMHPYRGGSFWPRTGNHGENCQTPPQNLRGWHQLLGPHLRGRKENRMERWIPRAVVPVQVFDEGTPSEGTYFYRRRKCPRAEDEGAQYRGRVVARFSETNRLRSD